MIARINIWKIIVDHFGTLRHTSNLNSKYIYWKDLLLFICLPILVSFTLTILGYTFEQCLGDLITAISILGGFLFNLLAIIYGQIDKIKSDLNPNDNNELQDLKKRFVTEIHSNISFCIVLSLILIVSLLSIKVDPIWLFDTIIFKKSITFLNYTLLLMFFLTLLMIINRIYILLKKDTE